MEGHASVTRSEPGEHPRDWAPKLVLADWLEERGDDRARLIRWWHQVQPKLIAAFDTGRRLGLSEMQREAFEWGTIANCHVKSALDRLRHVCLQRLASVAVHRAISDCWPTTWAGITGWPRDWNALRCRREIAHMLADAELAGLQFTNSAVASSLLRPA
jgi:uncharacterized protein (TIGR02996 family)